MIERPSKEVLLAEIAKSDDWRAKAWLVERLEKEQDTEKDGVDELEKKRAARKKAS